MEWLALKTWGGLCLRAIDFIFFPQLRLLWRLNACKTLNKLKMAILSVSISVLDLNWPNMTKKALFPPKIQNLSRLTDFRPKMTTFNHTSEKRITNRFI